MILVNYVPLIHSFQVLLPTGFRHKTLQGFTQVTPSKLKAHKLSEKQVNEMRNWRAMYGQSVPQKTVRNMTTKDNPINLYAADSLCAAFRFHCVLSETAATPVTHMETTETLYKLSYIVCVKADSSESHQLFISLSARECECRHEENESQSVHSRSFQSSAVHGRFREIRRCAQHCLCPNQL